MKYALLLLMFTNLRSGFGQELEPVQIAQDLLSTEKKFQVSKYSKGEFKGHPNGKDLKDLKPVSFRVLYQSSNNAVVNITLKDTKGKGFDSYLHFEKDENWKISAFRALALTGVHQQILSAYENLNDKQIDSLATIESKQNTKSLNRKSDLKFEIGNIKLILEFDDNIIKHFKNHEQEFENLRLEWLRLKENNTSNTEIDRVLSNRFKNLLLNGLNSYTLVCDDCLEMVIGGMVDNIVGYLFISDKSKLPKMSAKRLIMLREIGNGWYLFKTT